ncbi:MAG: bacteriophage abortive infection AbiH family protein [Bacteroides sp.]|nr:bacteriophage abortive infection AbiH family protein [Ruminococcus flavefaciens]MCM1554666.1 bacteriophage abortive infection AbiH family protein [Bacteroides sp.]
MNRIILIGNGFDLAHGLRTSYADFINWYWERRLTGFANNKTAVDSDVLCTFTITDGPGIGDVKIKTWKAFYEHKGKLLPGLKTAMDYFFKLKEFLTLTVESSLFLDNICKEIKQKGWADIENEYYKLLKICAKRETLNNCSLKEINRQFCYLRDLLIQYLKGIQINKRMVNDKIDAIVHAPLSPCEFSLLGRKKLDEYFKDWLNLDEKDAVNRLCRYKMYDCYDYMDDLRAFKSMYKDELHDTETILSILQKHNTLYVERELRPDKTLFLNFNYTKLAENYFFKREGFQFIYIHGNLSKDSAIIFGHGDEKDNAYRELIDLNDNEYLKNIKPIKYQESDNYPNLLLFISSAPYQVYIMGHSCGISDRTLLSTLFEHPNCVSIKPFYYQKDDGTDNYLDLVQNISRNFTDMKLMRDRVVNKTFCEPLPQCR